MNNRGQTTFFLSTAPAEISLAAALVKHPIAPNNIAAQPIFVIISLPLVELLPRTLPSSPRRVNMTLQQVELVFFVVWAVARPARLSAPRSPPQCSFDLALESLVAQCEVAVGGVAYLPDDFLIEVRPE